MRKILFCTVSIFCLLVAARKSDAQCVATILPYSFSCSVGSCHASGEGQTASGYGSLSASVSPVSCCGEPGFTTVTFGGYCGYAELSDPTVKRRLLDLARTEGQEYMIASCNGTFAPLADAVAENAPPLIERRIPLF